MSQRSELPTGLPFATALDLAKKLVDDLSTVVERVKVVGSLRRQAATVYEIDLLAEPRALQGDMFGADGPDLQPIRGVVSKWGKIEKGGDRYLKIVLDEPRGFVCDLFLCHPPAEWGSLLAIRTGPVEFSTAAVTLLRTRGFRHESGRILDEKTGQVVPTPDEETFFAVAGMTYFPPAMRGKYGTAAPNPAAPDPAGFERREPWAPKGKTSQPIARARVTDPETSHDAAARVGSSLDSMIDVLRVLETLGSAHDEAIVEGAPRLAIARTDSRIRTARADAVRRGWIEHTGTFSGTAAGGLSRVWRLTDSGVAALANNRKDGGRE